MRSTNGSFEGLNYVMREEGSRLGDTHCVYFIGEETVRCVNPWKENEMRGDAIRRCHCIIVYVVIECPEMSKLQS
jgi:hypothetical protein